MTAPLVMSISPYHLTSREAPAMAALLLADECVTLLPTPEGGREEAERVAADAMVYHSMIASWRWSVPLWESGVLLPAPEAAGDAKAAAMRIDRDERFGPLRPLMNRAVFEDESVYLQAVSHDVLKGGPDPALLVPLCAGLDACSARRGIVSARAEAKSVAQRAEARLSRRVAACVVPVLVQADGSRVMEARAELGPELSELRSAIVEMTGPALTDPESAPDPARKQRLMDAARVYTAAFEAVHLELTRCDDPDDARVLYAPVSVQFVSMPQDAALVSSASGVQTAELAERLGPLAAAVIKPMGRGSRG